MDIIETFLPLFKELTMNYGLYQTTACIALLILLWKLPALLNSLTRFLNRKNN